MLKYEKPKVVIFESNPVSGVCKNGSGASTSGCTSGPDVLVNCAPGAVESQNACGDGGVATNSSCYAGSTPGGGFDWGHCRTGTGPS